MNLNNSLRKTPVAVIGMSALFADAKNVEEFWNNIIQAKDSITDVPASRWAIEDYYDPDMTAPDKTYCKRGGFIPDVDFNPMEFGLPPNILEVTDASQLLGLIAARDALEDAGYGQKNPKFTRELKDKTGVLLGVGGGQKLITPLIARLQYPIWEKALRASGVAETDIPRIVDKMKKAYVGWNENSFPGLLGNVISGRITNRFDLGGINSVVDAACAASLSAIKMALSELVEGRADMMLTGGVDTDNSPFMYMSFSKTPAFSKSGNISPFSDKADGMLIGEGVGMIVLKRLEDAERDGDQIYAVIKGVGTSSDGRFKSVYAPRSSGQAMAIERAYEEAGFDPKTVGLLEAHGTGTGAGDPTEFNSMQMVFGKDNPQKQHIALGSVKSQIGHTKAAAGAAGIIKTILALHHKVLPPTINVEQPNSKFDIENSAIYINTATRPWMRGTTPRRASVSAFGFGGINVHIAMEEYTKSPQSTYRIHQPYQSILLNANTPNELLKICQNGLQSIEKEGEQAFKSLVGISNKGAVTAYQARLGFVATDAEECKAFLAIAIKNLQGGAASWEHPKGIYYRANGVAANTKVVALFSGQGSQYVGMGKEIANAFPPLLESFEKIDVAFEEEGKERLTKTIFPIPVFNKAAEKAQKVELTKTQNAQPAIGTLSMGLYKVLQQAGFKSDFTAGHSFGELTALWAAGVYDDATFLALAKARGAAMAATNPNAETGTMLAVKAPLAKVEQAITSLEGVTIANVNSTNQVILGGSNAAIDNAANTLKANGFSVVPLPVSAAFHTDFVGHAQKPFAAFVSSQKFNSPQIPVYSNTTSTAYPNDPTAIQNILQGHILKPVLFKNQVENMYQAGGRIFVEFGPKGVLTNLVKDILKGQDFQAVALNANGRKNSDLQLRQAAIQLRVIGVGLNEIDVYKKPSKTAAKVTKLNVKLGGHNYVSPPTKKAYVDVMNDGFKIQGGGTTVIEKPIIKEVEKIVEVEKFVEVPVEKIVEKVIYQNSHQEEEDMNKEVIQLLQSTMEHFKTQQTKSLELFERFLAEQNQQSQQLLNMMSQQLGPVQTVLRNTPASIGQTNGNSNGNGNGHGHATISSGKTPAFPPIVEEKIASVAPSTRLTEAVTVTKTVVSNEESAVSVAASSSLATEPVTNNQQPATSGGMDTKKLENILLTVISEKTGYPAEMLELSMDMEADLGIDSIKRVEIFGAMTEDYPEVSGINPNDLTELRTLGQIVDYLAEKAVGTAAVSSNSSQLATNPAPVAASQPVTRNSKPATGGMDTKKLENILLTVISEKTGYPAEMLELSMDMEADLGIDSIKRVEIFGAMTEDYPEVSGINPNDLTELRTLGQIVDYLAGKAGGTVAVSSMQQQSAVAVAEPSTPTPQPATRNPQPATGGIDKSKLEGILLTVISEKTGYPAEMLELSMDMEADLGIDSIKRVEIFGAMTEDYPEVSGINPNDLTELRTLGQIVDYLAEKAVGTAAVSSNSSQLATNPAPVAASQPVTRNSKPATGGMDTKKLENILLTVISEKTGYPAEMLELSMDMEADLGIDSIKRVEIFGAMTEDYPEVSGINPNDLTELRTLGQIVDYLGSKTDKKKSPSVTLVGDTPLVGDTSAPIAIGAPTLKTEKERGAQKAPLSTKTTTFHGVGRHQVSLEYLPQPDFLNFQLPATHIALITNDGTALTSETLSALKAQGNRVVVLNLKGVAQNPVEGNSFTLAENTDEAIATTLETIEQQYGKVGTFIHLHPHLTFQNGNFAQHFQAEKAIVKTVFLLAKHLQQPLNELGKQQRANFLTISQMDGHLGQGKRGDVSVLAGGLRGLIKSLNLEWSSVYCRAVDLAYELPTEQKSNQVIAELHDADVSIMETAFSKAGRKTIIATPVEVKENQEIKTTVTKDSVFLVSGGAKGVTATCVKEIAKTFGCKFILLGRSSNDFEIPAFAKNEDNEGALKRLIMTDLKEKGDAPSLPKVKSIYNQIISKKEIQGTLDDLASYGSEAIYIKGDVTNAASFKGALVNATTKLGTITGVIHGAGRLADKYIQDKTATDFDNVLSVKLDGLLSLLQSVNIHKLDHLILFSSVAGFYGNVGQTDYAIANEILSSAAHLFKTNHPNTHVSAINWGAWDGGMVSEALKKQFEAAGVSLVNSDGGAAMCVNELSSAYFNEPQVVIGGTLPAGISHISEDLRTHKIARTFTLKDNPFLYHHVIQGSAVLPVVNAGGWMSQSCEKLFPDFQVFKVEDMQLFKGIVFEDKKDPARTYTLALKELEKSTDKIVFESTVSSQPKGKKLPTFHYKSKVTLINKKAIPTGPKFQATLSGNYQPTKGDYLYLDGSLFHGHYFQGIEQILDWNEQQIVLSCKAPTVSAAEQGQFPVRSVNTFFSDIQYQGMVIWVQKYHEGAKSLPLATVSATIYEPVPFDKALLVHVEIVENSDYKLVANCTTYDADGKVYLVTEGAAVTVSKDLEW